MDDITLKLEPKSVGIILDLLDDQLTHARENPETFENSPAVIQAIL